MISRVPKAKRELAEKLQRETEEFVANGGVIQVVDHTANKGFKLGAGRATMTITQARQSHRWRSPPARSG